MDHESFDFDGDYGESYEALARRVIPGYRTLFPLIAALIDPELRPGARVLVVGAGTGIELVTFKRARPDLRLHGVDPSRQMIEIARKRVTEALGAPPHTRKRSRAGPARAAVSGTSEPVPGIVLQHGYAADAPTAPLFDAATLVNVLHFVPDDGSKADLLGDIARRLRPGGTLVLFDLHGDPGSDEHERYMPAWERYWRIRGMTEDEARVFRGRIQSGIQFAPPERVAALARNAGLTEPRRFFKGLLYGGWTFRRALAPQPPGPVMPYSRGGTSPRRCSMK